MTKFVGFRAKAYSYLIDDGSEGKKAKSRKKCVIKRKLKFENYKNCLEAIQLKNEINNLENNKTDIESLEKYKIEFIKNNKLTSKTQERFESEWHNVFTEEINKIALSSNVDERMQSVGLRERYACDTSKNLVSEKDEIKCNNIIKRYKNN